MGTMCNTFLPWITCNDLSQEKRDFIVGVTDDNVYGWAIAKSLASAGAEILVRTWVLVCLGIKN